MLTALIFSVVLIVTAHITIGIVLALKRVTSHILRIKIYRAYKSVVLAGGPLVHGYFLKLFGERACYLPFGVVVESSASCSARDFLLLTRKAIHGQPVVKNKKLHHDMAACTVGFRMERRGKRAYPCCAVCCCWF